MKNKLIVHGLLIAMVMASVETRVHAEGVAKLTVTTGDFNISVPVDPDDGLNDWAGDLPMNVSGVLVPQAFNFNGIFGYIDIAADAPGLCGEDLGGVNGLFLDLSNFAWDWSGNRVSGAPDPGALAVTSDGTNFTAEWSSLVSTGPFAGQTSYWYMEGTYTTTGQTGNCTPLPVTAAMTIEGGSTQECTEYGGNTVGLTAAILLQPDVEVATIEWFVDGLNVGSGESLMHFIAAGEHEIELLVTTTTGITANDLETIVIQDTTPPDLEVAFLSVRTGEPVDTAGGTGSKFVITSILATDVCDIDPLIEADLVMPVSAVEDGQIIRVGKDKIKSDISVIRLVATASDAAGHATTEQAVLQLVE